MKKWMKFVMVIAVISVIFVVGCKDDTTDPELSEFETLVNYLEGSDGGYINNMGSWILNEADVTLSDYLVLDLRADSVFSATPNPIAGAVNTTMSGMWAYADTTSNPILVTCYSGQAASFAHMLLRLKGYEAYVMKFGMSWHDEECDVWTDNCSDAYAGDLIFTDSPELPSFNYPDLSTGFEDAEEILDERVDQAIAAWSAGMLIAAGDVIDNPAGFNIMNYWGTTDDYHTGNPYITLGHIDEAYQLIPNTLTLDGNLSAFDPVNPNIFYCWTGQTAASALAYLYVIGYEDVKSIQYGFNTMHWSALQGHKWPKPYGE